jgi:hypothetical protein
MKVLEKYMSLSEVEEEITDTLVGREKIPSPQTDEFHVDLSV